MPSRVVRLAPEPADDHGVYAARALGRAGPHGTPLVFRGTLAEAEAVRADLDARGRSSRAERWHAGQRAWRKQLARRAGARRLR